jgi:hypothetical protein
LAAASRGPFSRPWCSTCARAPYRHTAPPGRPYTSCYDPADPSALTDTPGSCGDIRST